MNRKTLIVCLSVLAVLVGVTVFALTSLYSGRRKPVSKARSSRVEGVLDAVPTDAALVILLDGSRGARRLAADSTGIMKALLGSSDSFMGYLSRVSGKKTAVSLHNSGALVPLVVTELHKADSTSLSSYRSAADSAGMAVSYAETPGLLVSSVSETLVATALRHLEGGYSVLDSDGFQDALSAANASNVLLLSGGGMEKLFRNYVSRDYRKMSGFARSFARWSALKLTEVSPKAITLEGSAAVSDSDYLSSFHAQTPSDAAFPEVLPYATLSAVSVRVSDTGSYLEGYSRFSESRFGTVRFDEDWIKRLAIKEIVRARIDVEGTVREVGLMLTGADMKMKKGVHPWTRSADLAAAYGQVFSTAEDTCCAPLGKWTVFGTEASVQPFTDGKFLKKTLRDRLKEDGIDSIPSDGAVYYTDLTPGVVSKVFLRPLDAPLRDRVSDSGDHPLVVSAGMRDGRARLSLHLTRSGKEAVETILRDTVVVVPKGPFTVRNSQTGKDNTLYQNAHLSLCLKDENGRDQWGVPFREPICGCVENIDYYANGRIQFLFAAGSKLYLIDRLGRFVTGFPAELGKEVLLGPSVYDFTGAHGYRAVVLHKDNTLEMYNLHGVKPEGWLGIHPGDRILALPELIRDGEHQYWRVQTSRGTLLYGFYGGEPLSKKEANSILKRTKTL